MTMKKQVKAVALLSGGLDSILAARVIRDQGVEVLAVQFISPFFGGSVRGREEEVERAVLENFGLTTRIVDVSDDFLGVVGNPRYGYGKNFNPCVDCKIFLFTRALAIMKAEGASFLITGEVVGQRPMSQRRDTMNLIAREMGAADILLRPLSAKILPPTLPEREGWVEREKLFDFSGRNRKPQMALAEELGIAGYPTPAGGCSLTDVCLADRVRRYFAAVPAEARRSDDVRMMLLGRPFCFPGGGRLTLGRSEGENRAVARLLTPGDEFVRVMGHPGPLGIYRPGPEGDERALAAAVLLRYCPKAPEGCEVGFGGEAVEAEPALRIPAHRPDPALLESWRC